MRPKRSFRQFSPVQVALGSILDHDGAVDTFVSPANTIGNMDGGIDRDFSSYFDWSMGRPFHDANPLQLAIDVRYGKGGELPIGASLVVPVVPGERSAVRTVRFLVAAPTMRVPGALPLMSRDVHRAALAVFRAWREWDGQEAGPINAVAMPMFGTGYGEVPVWVAAAQMWEAFVEAWT